MAETTRFGSTVSARPARLILRFCGASDFRTSATRKITPSHYVSAGSTRLAGFTIPYISAAAGKAIAIALYRSKSPIATISTRTGCEPWKSAPERDNDRGDRPTPGTAGPVMAAACERHSGPRPSADPARAHRLVRRIHPSHPAPYGEHHGGRRSGVCRETPMFFVSFQFGSGGGGIGIRRGLHDLLQSFRHRGTPPHYRL